MGENNRNLKIIDSKELGRLRDRIPDARIVHCHGVFDVLHAGHLAYFESAKKHGDKLLVSITGDKFVNKGPGRPFFNSVVRASMIAALEVVDYVTISESPTATAIIESLRPNFYVKGPDYKDKARDVTGGIYEEERAVEMGGGKLVFTDDETLSSSKVINEFFIPWSEEQRRTIEVVVAAGGVAAIEEVLDRVAKLNVAVVGEPIVDTYVFCSPEAISSKSPSISAKFISEENHAGGSLAIANHLSTFVKSIDLFFTHGGEPYFQKLLEERMAPTVSLHTETLANVPTPRKTRFIEVYKSQRMFELTDLTADQWLKHEPDAFCEQLQAGLKRSDLAIIADFGHGLVESKVLDTLQKVDTFLSLNVQTNSSNFGFNPFTKHKRFNFLNIDTREVRIAYHDRFSTPLDLARRTQEDLSSFGASFGMTTGPNGAYFFPGDSKTYFHSPAFSDSVVDATGAGDAFFALASLLIKVKCPGVIIPFLGNVFAGLKTKIVGNRTNVTRAQLMKAVTAILK